MESGFRRWGSSLAKPKFKTKKKSDKKQYLTVPDDFDTDHKTSTDDEREFSDRPYTPDFGDILANPSLVKGVDGSDQEDRHLASLGGYLVRLTLISGHNLAIRDRSGASDPYVKIKHGSYKGRSTIVDQCLNPVWNEEFVFRTNDLSEYVYIRVYDHDYTSRDDFMGRGFIDLCQYKHNSIELVEVGLEDAQIQEELGFLRFSLEIVPFSDHQSLLSTSKVVKKKKSSAKLWNSVVTITLLEASDLPAMDTNGFSDPYCKFKLGSQKYKSKVQPKTLNPEWKEQFDMKLFHGESSTLYIEVWDRDFLASDDFIGGCSIDLGEYKQEHHYDLEFSLENSPGTIHFLLVISGITCKEEKLEDPVELNKLMNNAKSQYKLLKFIDLKSRKDIGLLLITVEKALGLQSRGGNPVNPFVSVEVGNAQLRTQTILNNPEPEWNRTFSFAVRDIHDVIYLSVFNDGKNKDEKLGQVVLPLLRVVNGVSKTYILKGKDALRRVPGALVIHCNLVYNHIRAGFRTIQPRECSVMEDEPRFQRKLLIRNIRRVIELVRPLATALQFIQSILSWQDPLRSSLAVIIYNVLCLFADIWIALLILVFFIMVFYVPMYTRGDDVYLKEAYQRAALTAADDHESDFSDLEDYIHTHKQDTPDDTKNLRQRFRQLQAILLTVQTTTEYIADTSERVKNLFYWSVPFLCWMAVIVCLLGTVLTYFVPLRYILMILGTYKITKKLWKPKHVPNNELLDFISRSPTDYELLQWKELSPKYRKRPKKTK